jgi:hypothetical protein
MIRRLTSLLIVWLGLLTVVVPTISCAAPASHGPCCPAEGAPPCGGCPQERTPHAPGPVRCVALPVQAAVAAIATPQSAQQDLSPEVPALASVVFPAIASGFAAETVRLDRAPAFGDSASFTYLVTGRLRL